MTNKGNMENNFTEEEYENCLSKLRNIDWDKHLSNINANYEDELKATEKICNEIENLKPYSLEVYNTKDLYSLLNYGFYSCVYKSLTFNVCDYYIQLKNENNSNLQKENNNSTNGKELYSSAILSFLEEYLKPFFKLNFENLKLADYPDFLKFYKENDNEELSKKSKKILCYQLDNFKNSLKNLKQQPEFLTDEFEKEKYFVQIFLDNYYLNNENEKPKFSSFVNIDKNLKFLVLPSPYFYLDDVKKDYFLEEIKNNLNYVEFNDFFNFCKQELKQVDKNFYSNLTKKYYKPEQTSKINLLLNYIKLIETMLIMFIENDIETLNNLIDKNSIIFNAYYFEFYNENYVRHNNDTILNSLCNNSNYFNNFSKYCYYLFIQLKEILSSKININNKFLLLNYLDLSSSLIEIYDNNLQVDKEFSKHLFEDEPRSFIRSVEYVTSSFLYEEKSFIKETIFEKNKDFNLLREINNRLKFQILSLKHSYECSYLNKYNLRCEFYDFFNKNLNSISNIEFKEIFKNSNIKEDITSLLKLCSLLKTDLNKKTSQKSLKNDYLNKNFVYLLSKINNLLNDYEEVEKLSSFEKDFFEPMLQVEYYKENINSFIIKTSFNFEQDYSAFITNISSEKYLPKFDEELFNEVCSFSLLNDDIKNSFASGEYYYRIGKNNKNDDQTKKVDFTPLVINFLKGGEQFLCACLDYIKQSQKIRLADFKIKNESDMQNIFDESKKTNWVDTSIALKYLKLIFEKTLYNNSVFETVRENVKNAFKNFINIRNPNVHKENLYIISSVSDAKDRTYSLITTLLSVCKIVKDL